MVDLIKKIKICAIAAGIGLAALVWSYYFPDKVVTTINETAIKRYGNRDIYLVFTDAGVFKNIDAKYRFKWRASDLQNKLIKLEGKKVEIKKYGWRIGLLSKYENVVGVKEVRQ